MVTARLLLCLSVARLLRDVVWRELGLGLCNAKGDSKIVVMPVSSQAAA
jgi:hypothetical protein